MRIILRQLGEGLVFRARISFRVKFRMVDGIIRKWLYCIIFIFLFLWCTIQYNDGSVRIYDDGDLYYGNDLERRCYYDFVYLPLPVCNMFIGLGSSRTVVSVKG